MPSYERTFAQLLPDRSFTKLIDMQEAQKGMQLNCLDVMGQGGFSDERPVNLDVGITLTDKRTREKKEEDAGNNKYIIQGNILQEDVWNSAKRKLDTHDTRSEPGYDIITCRPVLGLSHLFRAKGDSLFIEEGTNELRLFASIVDKMITLLHPDKGVLLFEHQCLHIEDDLLRRSIIRGRTHLKMSTTESSFRVIQQGKM